jgi:pectate lyase
MNSGKDFYDGLLDITHAADWVTVSWNKFHDHYKTCLVGHSDNNGAEDRGKVRINMNE